MLERKKNAKFKRNIKSGMKRRFKFMNKEKKSSKCDSGCIHFSEK